MFFSNVDKYLEKTFAKFLTPKYFPNIWQRCKIPNIWHKLLVYSVIINGQFSIHIGYLLIDLLFIYLSKQSYMVLSETFWYNFY